MMSAQASGKGNSLTRDSAAWLALDRSGVAQSPFSPPLVLEGGSGCEVWDVDGKWSLDFDTELDGTSAIVDQMRGLGLLWRLEMIDDPDARPETPDLAALTLEAMDRGLIIGGQRPGMHEGNVLRLAPPLPVRVDEIDRALRILQGELTAVESGRQRRRPGNHARATADERSQGPPDDRRVQGQDTDK